MRAKRETGFTMLDLAITLAVVGIALAVAAPGIKRTLSAYHRTGAAREVLAQVRAAQSAAITRGGVYAFQWGGDTGVNYPPDRYRVVKDTSGGCGLPAVGAAKDNTNVLAGWTSLAKTFPGTRIQSVVDNGGNAVGKIMFKSTGASVNTCVGVTFPITITLADDLGLTRQIEIRSAGSVRLR